MKFAVVFVLTVALREISAETAEKYKTYILQKHNEYRKMQRASNMQTMEWDDELAKIADQWASRCNFEHENKGYGENLAYDSGPDDTPNMEEAFKGWYNEINDYNYAGKICGGSCHYTQLVWHNTNKVGCAIKRCPALRAFGTVVKNGWLFGCWYSPKGNWADEYPFNRGAPCTECLEGQYCDDDLCAGEGKEKCFDRNENCVMWEAGGACKANPRYMEKNCRMSCGICEGGEKGPCEDLDPKCPQYAFSCESNKPWMKPNCPKTCGFC